MKKINLIGIGAIACALFSFMLVLNVRAQAGPDITTGLDAYWAFNEGSGAVAADSSGSGRSLTLMSDAAWGPGKIGAGSASFDGSNGYMQASDLHIGSNLSALSVSFWMKASDIASSTNRGLVCVPPRGSTRSSFCAFIQRSSIGSRIGFYVGTASGATNIAYSNAPLGTTDWVHVTGVYNGANVLLYVNGALQTSQPALTGATSDPGQPFRLNYSNQYGELGNFSGLIDDVRVYERALAPTDIDALFAMGDTSLPDTFPPSVSMTAPLDGSVASGQTTVSASASDDTGVASVAFYLDGARLGSDIASAPYSTIWDAGSAAVGAHALFAVARDAAGNVATSTQVSVTVEAAPLPDTVPPTVSVISPTAGDTVSGAAALSATSSDNVGVASVQFLVDGSYEGQPISASPFSRSWDTTAAANGSHSIQAVSRDAAGNAATSTAVGVTVNNAVSTSTTGIDDGLTMHLRLEERGGNALIDSSPAGSTGMTVGNPPWVVGKFGSGIFFNGVDQYASFASSAASNAGALSVSFWFKPNIGLSTVNRGLVCMPNQASTKAPFCFNISRSSSGGQVSFTVGTQTSKATVNTNAKLNTTDWVHMVGIYDGSRVTLYMNGVLQNQTAPLTGQTTGTALPIYLNFSNIYGNYGTFGGIIDEVRVYKRALAASEVAQLYAMQSSEAPFEEAGSEIWMSGPIAGSTVAGTSTRVFAEVDDGDPVASMQFYLDGATLGAVDAYPPYEVFWDTSKSSNGNHTLTATAVTPSGRLSTSSPVTVVVKNIPDVTPPSTPIDVRLIPVGPNQINVAWSPSVDDVGVTSYDVYRCTGSACEPTAKIGTKTVPFFIDRGLATSTTYSYAVIAHDAASNSSQASAPVIGTTLSSFASCSDPSSFSFGVFSDTYSGFEGGLRRALSGMIDIDPNVKFFATGGDTPSYERVRGLVDEQNGKGLCTGSRFPLFPSPGNHDLERSDFMSWWASNWTGDWANNPGASPLATQLPGVTNFRRGPLAVRSSTTTVPVPAGVMYSFDYRNAHFLIIDTYEQEVSDRTAGIWDYNGPSVSDPTDSQLDWIEKDLASSTKPFKFAFSHNAAVTPVYSFDMSPPGWSEHNRSFHMDDLARIFSENNVTAYIFGHDHVPSRTLFDGTRSVLYQRLYWDAYNDPAKPFGDSSWSSLQGPGKVWEVDAGRVYSEISYFTIVRVSATEVTFEIYYMPTTDAEQTYLWDTFTVPLPQ